MTLDEQDRQAAEACLRAALDALLAGRLRDAKELTEDAEEALFRVALHQAEGRG